MSATPFRAVSFCFGLVRARKAVCVCAAPLLRRVVAVLVGVVVEIPVRVVAVLVSFNQDNQCLLFVDILE